MTNNYIELQLGIENWILGIEMYVFFLTGKKT